MRTPVEDLAAAAIDDLAAALAGLGVPVRLVADELRVGPIDASMALDVHALAVATGPVVAARIQREPRRPDRTPVLVADRISRDARELLDEEGWGWLDRRGEVSLRIGDQYVIRTEVPAQVSSAQPATTGVVRGRAGIAYLAAALERPDEVLVLRAVARRAGLSHVALSRARAKLLDVGLVDDDGRPVIPEAFAALADAWRPEIVPVVQAPEPEQSGLALHLDQPDAMGWALTDTLAAVAWGARIAVGRDYPPDLYVPSPRELNRAIHVLGRADDFVTRGATVAVPAVPFAVVPRYAKRGIRWPVTHPLYVALAMARDSARAPELLDAWTPEGPDGFRRVW